MPKVFSVITINFNNLNGLKRTFESVQKQTAREKIEYIVVDGNSTDGSAEFLRENVAQIDTLIIEKDKGIYDAMNKGLRAATGEYVWFVNSGDTVYSRDVTENLVKLANNGPDVIFGDTMFTEPSGKEIGLISKMKPQTLPEHLGPSAFRYGMSVCHQSFLVKRELSPQYNLSYRLAADINWILEILEAKPSTAKYNGVIAGFETGGSSYQHEKKAWKERYNVLKSHYGSIPNFFAHVWIAMRRILFKLGLWKQ